MKMVMNNFCIIVHYRNPFIASGGVEKYIRTQVDSLKGEKIDSLVIFPVRKKIGMTFEGWGVTINEFFLGIYDEKNLIQILGTVFEQHTCMGIFIHHLKWCNLDSLAAKLNEK